jgi:hypothetical protein
MPTRTLVASLSAIVLAFVAIVAAGCQGNVFSLKVGECFTGTASGEISDVNKGDCGAAHDAEVISIFDYPNAPADFPGADAITTAAATQCAIDFKAYVGIDLSASTAYMIGDIGPTADSWKSGDHQIVCLINAFTQGTPLTGSAKDTKK